MFIFKNTKNSGITLIALVVTIIVLLILAGISISMLSGENGILKKASEAKTVTDRAQIIEQEQIDNLGGTMDDFIGQFNEDKNVNNPKITTGMVPVNYNETSKKWEKCTVDNWEWNYEEQSSTTENGGTSKWANAMTDDGSLWVWIPRYAYKIKSGYHTSTVGEIDVVFLVGATNKDKEGNVYATSYNMEEATANGAMSSFVVHPAFGTDLNQGGWGSNIPGFWVAKFEAGFVGTENATSDPNSIDYTNVKDSTVKYTSNLYYDLATEYGSIYGEIVPNETLMKYPIFKENAFSYTTLCVGDAFGLAKSLNSDGNPYGFSKNCNTHQMKNSEWGAVAYLTHSKYGRNGTEVTINNYLVPKPENGGDRPTSTNNNFSAKTGYSSTNGVSGGASNTNVTLYNEGTGYLSSSTGNVYGVYDLSGGAAEYVAINAEGLHYNNPSQTTYKSTQEYLNEYGSYLLSNSDKRLSNKLSVDTSFSNTDRSAKQQRDNYKTHNNIYGDAMWETSHAEETKSGVTYYLASWNGDYSAYPGSDSAFVGRGGLVTYGATAGAFCFINYHGRLDNSLGFRACVVSPD